MSRYIRTLALVLCVTFLLLEAGTRIYFAAYGNEETLASYGSHAEFRAARERPDGLRMVPHPYMVWQPRADFVRGDNRHNAHGFRGEEIPATKPEGEFWIACVGGSTTYDDMIEDWRETYPAQLEATLKAAGYKVRVINAGIPAATSYDSLTNYAFRLSPLKPDMVISYDAINDVLARMVWPPERYKPDNTGARGSTLDLPQESLYERSAFLRFAATVSGLRQPSYLRFLTPPAPGFLHAQGDMQERPDGSLSLDALRPGLTLQEMMTANPPAPFRNNMRHLAQMVKADGATCVFMTFAGAVRDPAQARGMGRALVEYTPQMNDTIREVAGEMNLPLLELPDQLGTDPAFWADAIHNTAEGAKAKAKIIADFLIAQHLLPAPH